MSVAIYILCSIRVNIVLVYEVIRITAVVALRFVPMQVMVCELEEFVQITVSKVGQSVVPVVVMVATQDSTAMGKISIAKVTN